GTALLRSGGAPAALLPALGHPARRPPRALSPGMRIAGPGRGVLLLQQQLQAEPGLVRTPHGGAASGTRQRAVAAVRAGRCGPPAAQGGARGGGGSVPPRLYAEAAASRIPGPPPARRPVPGLQPL